MDLGQQFAVLAFATSGAMVLATAVVLAFAAGRSAARAALASSFVLLASYQFFLVTLSFWPPAGAASSQDARLLFMGDLDFLRKFVAVLFLVALPVFPRWRSVEGALCAACLTVVALGAWGWIFERPLFVAADGGPTLLWRLANREGYYVALATVSLLAYRRAARRGREEDRAASWLVPAADPFVYAALGGVPTLILGNALGLVKYTPDLLVRQADDPFLLIPLFWLAFALLYGALVVARWRAGDRLPAALLVVAALVPLEGFAFGAEFWFWTWLVAALAPLRAMARHGAFGVRALPRWASITAGATAFGGVFILVASHPGRILAGSPVAPFLGIAAGLALGYLALRAVMPAGVAPFGATQTRDEITTRLGPYRATLEQEISSGSSVDEAFAKLRGLRARLGVTDHEHHVMEHALRALPGAAAAMPRVGERFLGRYHVEQALGEGGAGAAFLCRDDRLDRLVVVKALRGGDAAQGERLVREARLLGRVKHPNVVSVIDVEEVAGTAYLVMEHVAGGSLADRLRKGPLASDEFARVAGDLLSALEAVHSAGLVHRDVKPSNVLLSTDGEAKLADFGVARAPGSETTIAGIGSGAAIGTIAYMSPEQARGRDADARSDVYSAGATLYEAWSGRRLVDASGGETPVELQLRAAAPGPVPITPTASAALRAWFERALAVDPDARFAGAHEAREALARALSGVA